MKNLLLIIFLLNFALSNSQVKNGIIEYGVIFQDKPPKDDNGFIEDMINKEKKTDTLVSYTLKFNTKNSNFSVNPVILKDYKSVDEFSFFINLKSKYYMSISDSIHKYYENDDKIGEYTIAAEKEAKWTLTQETKMIGGYLCYKATSPYFNFESWFEDEPKKNVIAWYTTKIPVSIGPNGYHGLPGLILELQTLTSTIYVKNISLNTTPEPIIDDLSNYKLITTGQRDMLFNKTLSTEMRKIVEDIKKQKKEAADKLITK